MKNVIIFMAIAMFSIGVLSCKKDDPAPAADPTTTFKATLSGASEVPANASTATGTATLTFNTVTKVFTVTVTYSGVTANNGHIHQGAAGVSGPVIFPFASLTSPISYTSAALDATQESNLNGNLYYVNIHSAAFPAGEIRGQLIKQ
ncbi:CHRD domain-containing protein [Ferruginibacter sp. SUN106]|uniref:CHRD domain-containing protein n=1 Tax=Ferruginibacter sp. SUN106 TaxID=2978348 RepID=UPI003D3688D8